MDAFESVMWMLLRHGGYRAYQVLCDIIRLCPPHSLIGSDGKPKVTRTDATSRILRCPTSRSSMPC